MHCFASFLAIWYLTRITATSASTTTFFHMYYHFLFVCAWFCFFFFQFHIHFWFCFCIIRNLVFESFSLCDGWWCGWCCCCCCWLNAWGVQKYYLLTIPINTYKNIGNVSIPYNIHVVLWIDQKASYWHQYVCYKHKYKYKFIYKNRAIRKEKVKKNSRKQFPIYANVYLWKAIDYKISKSSKESSHKYFWLRISFKRSQSSTTNHPL